MPPQGSADETEFRRFRFGGEARLLDHFALRGSVNFQPENGRFYESISQAYLTYGPHGNSREDLQRFRLSVGKLKPRFSAEQNISPKRLKTLERSLLANQLAPGKTTGVLVAGAAAPFDYSISLMSGGSSNEFSGFDDGALLLAEAGFSPDSALRIGLDYLAVLGDAELTPGLAHAVSLSASHNLEYKSGQLAALGDLLIGAGQDGSPNTFGFVFLTSYGLSPSWELVGRYQFAHSDAPDGLRLQRRYELAVDGVADGGQGETYHAAYLGANYRIHPENLKFMTAVEYSQLDGGFDGWTWFVGMRTAF